MVALLSHWGRISRFRAHFQLPAFSLPPSVTAKTSHPPCRTAPCRPRRASPGFPQCPPPWPARIAWPSPGLSPAPSPLPAPCSAIHYVVFERVARFPRRLGSGHPQHVTKLAKEGLAIGPFGSASCRPPGDERFGTPRRHGAQDSGRAWGGQVQPQLSSRKEAQKTQNRGIQRDSFSCVFCAFSRPSLRIRISAANRRKTLKTKPTAI